jgi:uncharacterized spore protein YtfJ
MGVELNPLSFLIRYKCFIKMQLFTKVRFSGYKLEDISKVITKKITNKSKKDKNKNKKN